MIINITGSGEMKLNKLLLPFLCAVLQIINDDFVKMSKFRQVHVWKKLTIEMMQEHKIEFGPLVSQSHAEQSMPKIWQQLTDDNLHKCFFFFKKDNY